MQLGMCKDGRLLTYDVGLYEFHLAGKPATLEEVRALDARALIHWRAPEQRDWLRRINAADFAACHEKAFIERNEISYDKLTAEERVQADAARDDSVLAGKIVEADPALVHAVANQLIEQGLLKEALPVPPGIEDDVDDPDAYNPLAVADLPRGMEPLSQLERAKGVNRKMTRSEARLMKKILKNDDKEKERRERRAAANPPPKKEEESEEKQASAS